MVKIPIILCILVIFALPLAQSIELKDIIQSAHSHLKDALKIENGLVSDLQNTFFLVQSLLSAGIKESELTEYKICDALKKLDQDAVMESGSTTDFRNLNRLLNCKVASSTRLEDWIKKNSLNDRLVDFHTAASIGLRENLIESDKVAQVCNRTFEFVDKDGSGKSARKKLESSYENTPLIFEVALLCAEKEKEKNATTIYALEGLKTLIQNIFSSLSSQGDQIAVIPEGDHFTTTAHILYYILKFESLSKSPALNPQAVYELANFLKEHAHQAALSTKQSFYFQLVAKELEFLPFLSFNRKFSINSGKKTLTSTFTNIFGQPFDLAKNPLKISASVSQEEKVAIDDIKFTVKDNAQYDAEIDTAKLKSADFYKILFTIASSGSNKKEYKFTESDYLVATTKSAILSLGYDVTKDEEKAKEVLPYQLKPTEVSNDVLPANQNSYIHVNVKVNKELPILSQVAVRLIHPSYRFSTGTVAAKFDKSQYTYEAVIDLGDPDHILPYNEEYEIELVVAGPLLEEITRWKFAKFNITFVKPAANLPPTDGDVATLPEIHHQFPAERKKTPTFLTGIFIALIIIALGAFFVFLKTLNVNLNRFPKKLLSKVINLLFLVTILGLLGILVLFWVQINLFQTLFWLTVSLVPTLIIGNWALNSISTLKSGPGSKVKSE